MLGRRGTSPSPEVVQSDPLPKQERVHTALTQLAAAKGTWDAHHEPRASITLPPPLGEAGEGSESVVDFLPAGTDKGAVGHGLKPALKPQSSPGRYHLRKREDEVTVMAEALCLHLVVQCGL